MASCIHSDILLLYSVLPGSRNNAKKDERPRPPGAENKELGHHAMRARRGGQKMHRGCKGVYSHSQHWQEVVQTLEKGGTEVPPTRTAATDYNHGVVEPT